MDLDKDIYYDENIYKSYIELKAKSCLMVCNLANNSCKELLKQNSHCNENMIAAKTEKADKAGILLEAKKAAMQAENIFFGDLV